MPTTLLTDTNDKILTLTLNRPEKLNALTDNISVVIIKSVGRAFCVGYDLNEENWITSQYPANRCGGDARGL